MKNKIDLFEDVRVALGCTYISDIKYGSFRDSAELYLKTADLSKYPRHQLADMAAYLYNEEIEFQSADDAMDFFRASEGNS